MAFTSSSSHVDGTPAASPTLTTVAPMWRPGDTIPLGGRTLRVVDVRDGDDPDARAVLVVEDTSE
jgi:hypothetical protein